MTTRPASPAVPAPAETVLPETVLPPARSPAMIALRRGLSHGGFLIGGGLVGLVVLVALAAPLLAPHDPYAQDVSRRLIPPIWHAKGSMEHILGTDKLGRDYLSRLIYGSQISLLIGLSAALISGVIGTTVVVLEGY